jgi:hypothetical protein
MFFHYSIGIYDFFLAKQYLYKEKYSMCLIYFHSYLVCNFIWTPETEMCSVVPILIQDWEKGRVQPTREM